MTDPNQKVKTSGTVGPRRRHVERLVRSGQRPNGSVSSTFLTTPTHPKLQTTLSSAGCRRLVHFIDYLTIYLARTWIGTIAMSCYTSLSTLAD